MSKLLPELADGMYVKVFAGGRKSFNVKWTGSWSWISTKESAVASLCQTHLQGIGAIGRAIGQAGVWWLLHRSWPDNEAIRDTLGLNRS
ncbi:MAG: hypothetical protein EOO42_23660 [Flavobacteriales bacterium]|nr:MAG: hypothetical protein EOO42_23660 [Flavobacteriales bacterium]